MPGNERRIFEFLRNNKGKICLPVIGKVEQVTDSYGADNTSSDDARKKADIMVNDIRVSLKQEGGSFPFNRWQRKNIMDVLEAIRCADANSILKELDIKVKLFHEGKINGRARPWNEFFKDEEEFYRLVEFFMMVGSPNLGDSPCPAELIVEAPSNIVSASQIRVFPFSDYFNSYKDKLYISIRRSWYGQDSKTEHGRAKCLMKSEKNRPWVFDQAVGIPSSGWRSDIPVSERKTVYYLMVEKKR